jgi:tight adherence protein C
VSLVLLLGALAGMGCLGVVVGLRDSPPPLEAVAASMDGKAVYRSEEAPEEGLRVRIGRSVARQMDSFGLLDHPRLAGLASSFVITDETPELLASRVLVSGGAALVVSLVFWMVAIGSGSHFGALISVVLVLVGVPIVAMLPVFGLLRRARERRRHFRVIMSSFVDLVVLSLAGGVGVEGALFSASQVTGDWTARRIARSLATAQDKGQSPWSALNDLGTQVGVPELVELSSTLELAGTEGARVRQSLQARADSFRRHEQAEAESTANAMTERLFLPGSLLLFGFLLFIGYPAFSRIIGGL